MENEILLEDVPPVQSKRVAITLGRFQPPTVGHYKVINKMADAIRNYNKKHPNSKLETNPVVVIIRGTKSSKDGSRNPLDFDTVVKIMKASGQIDGKTIFIKAKSAFDAFAKVREAGFEPILVFGGSDRGTSESAPYKDILDKYFTDVNGKKIEHEFVSIKRNDATELDEKSQDTLLDMIEKDGDVDPEVVSGTLARKAVAKNLKNAFAAILGLKDKEAIANIAFKKVKEGLKEKKDAK